MVGRTVSHFRIVGELGQGGMGVVYRAEDTRLGRPVALKFLPEALAHDRHALERFRREARAASALNHPHICTIYDVDEAEGQPFIAMELLEGESLRSRAGRGRMEAATIVEVGVQVADALQAAHAKGVVHRDVKPENIFVTTGGTAKLLDFGVAKLMREQAAATAMVTATRTDSGAAPLGTVAYMSPEQVRGEELDGRTDLFSLGVVLYELATGVQPFRGTTSGVVLGEILSKAPMAPVQLNPGVPRDLERIVNKLLEKDRSLRYQSASELRVDLERLRRALAPAFAPPPAIPEAASIVVLPFDNLSPDPDNAFFADGLTEEIIADLSKVRSLRVISRTSAMLLRGCKKDIPTIARQMNVRYVLEGSVRRWAQHLRITAQLIDAANDTHVWAEKYTGTPNDVFEMQERVSQAIVEALRVTLTPEERNRMASRPIANVAAYDCYLRARREIWRFDEPSLARAVALVQRGLEIVGENELLYAAMGMAYCQYAAVGIRPEANIARAEECVAKIDALSRQSSHGHALRGLVSNRRGDMQQAVRHLKAALAADPNDAETILTLVYSYLTAGRPEAARPLIRKLLDVDPLTFVNHCMPGWADVEELKFDEAVESYRRCHLMEPENPLGRFLYGWGLALAKRVDEAFPVLDGLAADRADLPIGRLARCLGAALRCDDRGVAEAAAALEEAAQWNDFNSARLAECHALVRHNDAALAWLENGQRRGIGYHAMLSRNWFLSSLHGDRRFRAMLDRMKQQCEAFEV